jgi:excisionase family DNA binding protein
MPTLKSRQSTHRNRAPLDALRVYTPEEATAVLKVGRRTLLELLRTGQLPGRKVGGQWRIAEPALLTYLQGQYAAAALRPLAEPKARKANRSQRSR